MKKEYYEELKKQNPFLVKKVIHQQIKEKYPDFEDLLLYRTAIAFLAAKYKELQSIKKVEGYIKDYNEEMFSFLSDVIKEYEDFIIQLSQKFTLNYFEATVLFSAEKMLSKNYYSDTPDFLSELAIEILEIDKNDVLLDLGSGMGDFLTNAKLLFPKLNSFGIEKNKNLIKVAKIRDLLLKTKIDYLNSDFVSEPKKDLLANKIFCNPPLGIRRDELKNLSEHNKEIDLIGKESKEPIFADWDYVFSAYENMTHSGKAVVLISVGITSNSTDIKIREKLLNKNVIEKVILLPKNMLYYVGQETVMLVLSNGNKKVKMIDTSTQFETLHRRNYLSDKNVENIIKYLSKEDLPNSRDIDYQTIKENDCIINPQRYLRTVPNINKTNVVFSYFLNEAKEKQMVSLGELCQDITRGAMIKSAELRSLVTNELTDYAYLELKNINDESIDFELPYLKNLKEVNDGKWMKYCLKENQVIISKMYPFKTAIVQFLKGRNILATGNLYALDINTDKVDPWYLIAFLQSNAGLSEMERYATGSAFKMLSITDLKQIRIPLPSRSEQRRIAEEYEELFYKMINLKYEVKEIQEKKEKLFG